MPVKYDGGQGGGGERDGVLDRQTNRQIKVFIVLDLFLVCMAKVSANPPFFKYDEFRHCLVIRMYDQLYFLKLSK